VIPGSHKQGKVDIKAMVRANGGSEQLPGAVPLVCEHEHAKRRIFGVF
jgi:hypothetical protein